MKITGLKLISEAELVQLISVSRATIYRWEREGKFPKRISFGVGRRIAFRASDIDAFLNSRERGFGPRVCVKKDAA
jgi:predicted DNA-binding transcriptional regulator AlpA